MDTQQFIEAVREFSFLYDARHADYKNVVKKAEAWMKIADKFGQTSGAVKMKWKNLRDSYLKYRNHHLKRATGTAKKYHKWPWGSYMEFLDDSMASRPSSSNVITSEASPSSCFEDGSQNDSRTEYTEDDHSLQAQQISTPSKRTRPAEASGEGASEMRYLDYKNKPECDGIDHLFLSYAETFKTLSPRAQVKMKMDLALLFGQAELNELDSELPLHTPHVSMDSNSSSSEHNQ